MPHGAHHTLEELQHVSEADARKTGFLARTLENVIVDDLHFPCGPF